MDRVNTICTHSVGIERFDESIQSKNRQIKKMLLAVVGLTSGIYNKRAMRP